MGGGDRNPGSTNKYTKFGQLIIRKIVKMLHQMSHFNVKMHQSLFVASVRLSLCPFLRLSVCVSDGVWHESIMPIWLFTALNFTDFVCPARCSYREFARRAFSVAGHAGPTVCISLPTIQLTASGAI